MMQVTIQQISKGRKNSPSKVIQMPSSISDTYITWAKAFRETPPRQQVGTGCPQSKAIQPPNSVSA